MQRSGQGITDRGDSKCKGSEARKGRWVTEMERSQCGWIIVAFGEFELVERIKSCRPCGMYNVATGRLIRKQNDLICI